MKRVSTLLMGCLLTFGGVAYSQLMREQWRELVNGNFVNATPELRHHLRDAEGNTYHVGSISAGSGGVFVISLAPEGATRWTMFWNEVPFPSHFASFLDPDGNLQVFLRNSIVLHFTSQGELVRQELLPVEISGIYYIPSATCDSVGNRYLWIPIRGYDALLAKISPSGTLLWTYTIPNLRTIGVYVDRSGNVVVVGGVPVPNYPNSHRLFIAKFDPSGNLLWSWQDTFPTIQLERVLGEDSLGQLVVSNSTGALVFSPNGSLIRRFFSNTGASNRYIIGVSDRLLHPDGRIFASVLYNLSGGGYATGVFCHSLDGTLLWERIDLTRVPFSFSGTPHSKIATSGTSDALWFSAPISDSQGTGFLTAKLDRFGNPIWSARVGATSQGYIGISGLLVAPNGQSLVVTSEPDGSRLIRYSDTGVLLSEQRLMLGVPTRDTTLKLGADGEGGVYALMDADGRRLRRYSAEGLLLWEKREPFIDFVATDAGDIVALSQTSQAVRLTRYSREGQQVWQETYSLQGNVSSSNLYLVPDGTFYITAMVGGVPNLLKVSANGQLLWRQVVSDSTWVSGVAVASDGSLYWALRHTNGHFVERYNPTGSRDWRLNIPSSIVYIRSDNQSRLVLLTIEGTSGEPVRILRVYSPPGALVWESVRNASSVSTSSPIAVAPSGDIYLLEYLEGQLYLSRVGSMGELIDQEPSPLRYPNLSVDTVGNLYLWGVYAPLDSPLTNRIEVYRRVPNGTLSKRVEFAGPVQRGNQIYSLLVEQGGARITLGGITYAEMGNLDALVARFVERQRGDVDGNGCVDDSDLVAILFAFGNTGTNLPEDLNGDGIVDDADLLEVLFHYGQGCE